MPKRLWATLILGLVTTCSVAKAEGGLSYLALCQKTWPCSKSLSAFDGVDTIRTGWLERTFGRTCPCGNRILKDPRPKVIRVHLANGACLRNGRCGRYEVFHGQTIASAERRIKRGDKRLLKRFEVVAYRLSTRLAQSRGPLTCFVSPVLESDFDGQTRSILHRLTASLLPGCRLVDNPIRGKCIAGATCERHGPDPGLSRPCVADLDGSIVADSEKLAFLYRTRQCAMSLIWTPEMNCNSHHSPTFIDPRSRVCAQSRAYYEGLTRWLTR